VTRTRIRTALWWALAVALGWLIYSDGARVVTRTRIRTALWWALAVALGWLIYRFGPAWLNQ